MSVVGALENQAMLSERQLWILAFETSMPSGNREGMIRSTFEVSPARYYQELYAILDDPSALEVEPMLIDRLLRLRGFKSQTRVAWLESHPLKL